MIKDLTGSAVSDGLRFKWDTSEKQCICILGFSVLCGREI